MPLLPLTLSSIRVPWLSRQPSQRQSCLCIWGLLRIPPFRLIVVAPSEFLWPRRGKDTVAQVQFGYSLIWIWDNSQSHKSTLAKIRHHCQCNTCSRHPLSLLQHCKINWQGSKLQHNTIPTLTWCLWNHIVKCLNHLFTCVCVWLCVRVCDCVKSCFLIDQSHCSLDVSIIHIILWYNVTIDSYCIVGN